MKTKEIRRHCRDLVRELDVPSPFDMQKFVASLAASRGRPIDLVGMAMPADSACGMWIGTAERDYIFYEQRTSGLHQEHIIMHEIGHLLAGHGSGNKLGTVSQVLLPHLDPALVHRVLNRTVYSVDEERAAETTASMILERANRWQPVSEWDAPLDGAEMRERVEATFEPATDRRRP